MEEGNGEVGGASEVGEGESVMLRSGRVMVGSSLCLNGDSNGVVFRQIQGNSDGGIEKVELVMVELVMVI